MAITRQSKKSGKNWALILFALPFTCVGIGFLLFGVVPTFYDWTRMQSWLATDARLSEASLNYHRGDKSTSYSVSAVYHYQFAGQDYRGTRVAIGSSADNIGDFQGKLGRRLERALRKQSPIQIWVNPSQPTEAIIDRSLRIGLLGFKMIFVLVFGGIGIGLLVFQWKFADRNQFVPAPVADRPWLKNSQWAKNRIGSQQRLGVWVTWAFASFWNLISAPLAFILPGEVANGNYPALIGFLFPLVGIWLIWWAIKATLDWRRFGEVHVTLDPFPGALGGHVGGKIEVGVPYTSYPQFLVTLNCIYHYVSGSGKSRSRRENLIWQIEGLGKASDFNGTTRIEFRFDVPNHLPASEPANTPYHAWRLDVKSVNTEMEFSRQFTIPVFATEEHSRFIRWDSAVHPLIQKVRQNLIKSVCHQRSVDGGIELEFPMLRYWKNSALGLLFGCIFTGMGILLGYSDAPKIFFYVFTGLGGLIAWTCIHSLFNSFSVRLDADGLHKRQFFLGIKTGEQKITLNKINILKIKQSHTTQSGREFKKIFNIIAEVNSGKSIKIADSLDGEATAQMLLQEISRHSGIPCA